MAETKRESSPLAVLESQLLDVQDTLDELLRKVGDAVDITVTGRDSTGRISRVRVERVRRSAAVGS